VRRLALLLVGAVALAGCGGSSHTTTTDGGAGAQAQAQIKSAYEKFFSGKTPVSDRVAVLQNGPKFRGLVTSFANNPLAKNVSVKVSSVTLRDAVFARVVYTVELGGSGLPKQTGTAVRENGTWKVGDASLCKLVSLQGSTPSVCKP
jgi:hypothetical protein